MKEIKKIRIHQSAKVIATMTLLMSLVFVVPAVLWILFFTDTKIRLDSLALLLIPLFYFLFQYIFNVVLFFFYNLASRLVGGIEVETGE